MNKNFLCRNRIINTTKENLLCYSIIFVITIFISMGFTTNPFSKTFPYIDSDAFIEVGRLLKNEKVLYKDIFDHKGPFMYLIQYIGLSISDNFTGIWILEVVFLLTSLCFFYKTARLWLKPLSSILCVVFTISLLPKYLSRGNYVEEFALPLVAISLYIFSIYFKDRKYNIGNLQLFILGVCFGLAIMLRPNTAALWPSFCFVIFIHLIVSKNFKLLYRSIILFSVGLFAVLSAVLFYMIKNNALPDFINSYLVFNFKYSNVFGMWNKFTTFIEFIKNEQFYISVSGYIVILVFIKKIENEKLIYYIASFIFFIGAYLFTIMSGRTYLHYCMQLIPAYLVPTIYVFLCFEKFLIYLRSHAVFPIIIVIISTSIIVYNLKSDNSLLNTNLSAATWVIHSQSYDDKVDVIPVVDRIKEKTNLDDKIIIYNIGKAIIYLLSEREPASKYFFQPLWVDNTGIGKEFIEDIESNKPKAIILSPKNIIDENYTEEFRYVNQKLVSILQSNYTLDLETENLKLYIRN